MKTVKFSIFYFMLLYNNIRKQPTEFNNGDNLLAETHLMAFTLLASNTFEFAHVGGRDG